ncbi:ATP-binding protein [Pirellulaceae bacterium SH467]
MHLYSADNRTVTAGLSPLSPRARWRIVEPALVRVESGDFSDFDRQITATWEADQKRMDTMIAKRGVRYANCTLDNYETPIERQAKVVSQLKDYAFNAGANIAKGKNVILWGTKGTGKDHLLMGLARQVFAEIGRSTRWVNGCDLHAKLQDTAFGRAQADPYDFSAPILWISDPLPPSGALSDFQKSLLFGLVDARYSKCLPTWVSINVTSGEEFDARIGSQIADRLRHNALMIPMDWPSYRSRREPN